ISHSVIKDLSFFGILAEPFKRIVSRRASSDHIPKAGQCRDEVGTPAEQRYPLNRAGYITAEPFGKRAIRELTRSGLPKNTLSSQESQHTVECLFIDPDCRGYFTNVFRPVPQQVRNSQAGRREQGLIDNQTVCHSQHLYRNC